MSTKSDNGEDGTVHDDHVQASVLGALLAAETAIPSPDGLTGLTPALTDSALTETTLDTAGLDSAGLDSAGPRSSGPGAVDHSSVVEGTEKSGPSAVASKPGLRSLAEWAVVVLCAVVISVLVRQFLFQAFYIESGSMESTLVPDDRVLVNRLSYKWTEHSRGDVVVFSRLPNEPGTTRDLIKRIIGLPGDEVEGRDGVIYINGVRLDEPYIDDDNRSYPDFGPELVGEGQIFVMGDNRDDSLDSRRFGAIDSDRAAGRAFITYWPLGRAGSL